MHNSEMACLCAWSLLILATMTASVDASKELKVGGSLGWCSPSPNNTAMYSEWATSKRFHVGDSLVFEYQNDSVLVVDKWGYFHCNTNNPISGFSNGSTTIQLDRPGPFYFISGAPEHCISGQKLFVKVIGLHPPGAASADAPGQRSGAGLMPMVTTGSLFMGLLLGFLALV